MKKIYFLKSCSTCQRILKEIDAEANNFELQNIKVDRITSVQLEEMRQRAGSYEALFSRTAMKYKALNLKDKNLNEEDYKTYILDEYTFLKRPVSIIGDGIFIGNSKKVIEALKTALD
ncbi:MAG: ArsC/Spx/MgsR family protein [Chitinophagales bacterium]|jgi:arsenate reductase|tara:strand:+ start:7206 stop:7559 length:354 start_codon:yes stop_codon:yes gene_type:complete